MRDRPLIPGIFMLLNNLNLSLNLSLSLLPFTGSS